ncbi:DUF6702 family protein [Marinoscillum furvescens]|uniref:Peptidase E n=1 Tax=Marinoscillum furvescens DSM 4134 TaxID=1122208 RepID=A0A3D9L2N3_MARFU|nr:DUF6702 family protein [Marinoscillum furvescens]RED98978.1 hypothetical protein C7460_109170 [Marinoscillum furvescens DSM 4134]
MTSMLLFLFSLLLHPYYVSVCDVVYDEDTQALQITHRIFLDDLEQAIKPNHPTVSLLTPSDERKAALTAYFNSHFALECNGEKSNYDFLGAEIEDDVIWCYLEVQNVKEIPKLRISNKILLEVFDDQKNLVHFKMPNDKKSFILDAGQVQAEYLP